MKTRKYRPATRTFHWVSRLEGEYAILESIHEEIMGFYARKSKRSGYQSMLDDLDEELSPNSSTVRLTEYIRKQNPKTVLEVGCGSGRLFRSLSNAGFDGKYTGIEVAEYVIEQNRDRHPEATWHTADAYDIPAEEESVDMVVG